MNRDNVQQKHRRSQSYVVFLEHKCFPYTKVEICQIISGQLAKDVFTDCWNQSAGTDLELWILQQDHVLCVA